MLDCFGVLKPSSVNYLKIFALCCSCNAALCVEEDAMYSRRPFIRLQNGYGDVGQNDQFIPIQTFISERILVVNSKLLKCQKEF